ncbi:MAG: hypothetical protein JSS23_00115 [Proteobacteria bacterium]|nr:hypothetical protein [Pseudomonadota bacterium]
MTSQINGQNPVVPNLDGRQYLKYLYVQVTLALWQANGNQLNVSMPDNSEVVGGHVNVDTASDDASTDTLSVGDSGNATRYYAAIDLKTAARTSLTATGYKYTSANDKIILKRTVGDSPETATVGTQTIAIGYLQLGESKFTQG